MCSHTFENEREGKNEWVKCSRFLKLNILGIAFAKATKQLQQFMRILKVMSKLVPKYNSRVTAMKCIHIVFDQYNLFVHFNEWNAFLLNDVQCKFVFINMKIFDKQYQDFEISPVFF